MAKKILIVCDAFPPNFAPRVGNLCKHLNSDFELTIVTRASSNQSWPVQLNRQPLTIHSISLTQKKKWVEPLITAGDYLFNLSDHLLYKEAIKRLNGASFDLVFCTSYYIFPLLCGEKLSHFFHIPLYIDLRDIMEQNAKPHGFAKIQQFFKLRWLNQWRRNRILKNAAYITTVSPWHVKTLQKYNPNVELIYNGYDREQFIFQPIPTDRFIITYTGRLLDLSLRDPRLLFEAIKVLIKDNDFEKNLTLQWYVDKESKRDVESLAQKYDLLKYMEIHDIISSDKMPEVLNHSSIVLVLSNKATEDGPHGIMTTKFYEALGCEKPILCVRSDEDCLAETIEKTNAGLAGTNIEDVKNFTLNIYQMWRDKGFTHQEISRTEKEKFTRQVQAKQFEQLFNQVYTKNNP